MTPRENRRPTGHDVARLAGVSQATVSLALSADPGSRVSETTQAKVRAAAEQLDYRPSAIGRALRQGRSGLLLLAIPDVRAPFSSRVAFGAQEAARASRQTIVLAPTVDHDALHATVLTGSFDALILCSPLDSLVPAADSSPNTILLDADPRGGHGHRTVELDLTDGMRQAVDHLRELGHRRLGRFRRTAEAYTVRARQRAFLEAAAGLETADVGTPRRDDAVGALAAAEDFFAASNHPQAVICDDEILATALYRVAARRGVRIPEDLSVISLENNATAPLAHPGLTAVDLHGEELGRLGVEMANTESVGRVRTLGTNLVVRESTAPPGH